MFTNRQNKSIELSQSGCVFRKRFNKLLEYAIGVKAFPVEGGGVHEKISYVADAATSGAIEGHFDLMKSKTGSRTLKCSASRRGMTSLANLVFCPSEMKAIFSPPAHGSVLK